MDPHSGRRHRISFDPFLTPSAIYTIPGEDFDEEDVFDTTSPLSPPTTKTTTNSPPELPPLHSQRSFNLESSGILAALPEPPASPSLSIFNHKPRHPPADKTTTTPSRTIPILPRTSPMFPAKYAASSAPIHVPLMPAPKGLRPLQRRREGSAFGFEDIDDDVNSADNDKDDNGKRVQPHEMVARRLAGTPVVSCSVLEGAGRTLKGRDLRQVRNAVFRQTGFID